MEFAILKAALVGASLAATQADAACGLHSCPRHEPVSQAWRLGWTQGQTGFDIENATGTYSEGSAEIQFKQGHAWVAGAHIPFLALSTGSQTAFGLGNPLAMVEYRMRPGTAFMLSLGLQGEVPLGDSESGLAQEHFMLMPYAGLSKVIADFSLSVSSGLSKAIGHHHEAGMDMGSMEHSAHATSQAIGSPLYVNPHEDFEWSYRVSAGLALQGGTVAPEISLSGQHVLSEPSRDAAGVNFLSAGISAPIRFGRYILTPDAAIPLSPDHRFEWAVSLGFAILM